VAETLSDSTAASWTRRLYAEAGIKSSKVTHAGRVSGARLAELNGVPEDQIRRGGRWNADQNDWLLFDYPAACIHAWYCRLRPGIGIELLPATRDNSASPPPPEPYMA
jgi:hypothetical protein